MSEKARSVIHVEGMVQGVGYRNFVEEWAAKLGLRGYCQNLPDGRVVVEVEGERVVIELLVEQLKNGPRRARVERVDLKWATCTDKFFNFVIRY